jgi:NhaP-type Na+/H+ or K+/H+ antiporter
MDGLHLVYAASGTLAVVLALVSREIHQLPLSEPLIALLLGIALGPQLFGVLEISDHMRDQLLLEGSRLLLAGSVMAAALRFAASDLRPLIGPVILLLVVVMPLAALASAAVALVLGLPLALAVLVGACLCPTDPVLAASVVSGGPAQRDLPARLRQLLTAESGANDGLALPLVGSAIAVVLTSSGPGAVAVRLAWEVLGGTLIGASAGALAGLVLRAAVREQDLDKGAELVFTLLLAVAVLGVARLVATGGVLAVFVAGLAYNRAIGPGERGQQAGIDEAVNRYAVLPLFVVLGAVLPWAEWAAFGPAALAFIAGVLLVRRLPLILLLRRPLGLDGREAPFVGWFGPMGVSAVFYLAHSLHEGVTDPRLFAAGTLAVVASVVAFGLTATAGRKAFGGC